MSALCVSAVLLCTVVAELSARALTATSRDDLPLLSPRHYQHTDRDSGTQLVCDKCPAGTYVSVHCSPTAVRECSPCPEGTFTRGENGVQQCHRCQAPCPAGLIEKAPCTATQDRVCTCPRNSFLLGDGVAQCKPHSLCPPGTRVKKRGSETEDSLCKPCTKGTFSDMVSSAMRCRNHTNCQVRGLVLLIPGTRKTDNVCGPTTAMSPVSMMSPLGSKQAAFVQESMNAPIALSLTEHKVDTCKVKWKALRDGFVKNRKRSLLPSGSAGGTQREWKYSDIMSFLLPFVQPRSSRSNINSSRAEESGETSSSPSQQSSPCPALDSTSVSDERESLQRPWGPREHHQTPGKKAAGKKRKPTEDDIGERLLGLLGEPVPTPTPLIPRDPTEESYHFLVSLVPALSGLDPRRRRNAQLGILRLIGDLEDQHAHEVHNSPHHQEVHIAPHHHDVHITPHHSRYIPPHRANHTDTRKSFYAEGWDNLNTSGVSYEDL